MQRVLAIIAVSMTFLTVCVPDQPVLRSVMRETGQMAEETLQAVQDVTRRQIDRVEDFLF